MKSNVIKTIFPKEAIRNQKEFENSLKKKEIVLEQDLRYRYSCIIEKLGLLENQIKFDAKLDSKD